MMLSRSKAPMGRRYRTARWGALLLGLAAVGLVVVSPAAQADTVPPNPPGLPPTVSADALPTVQVDGVVWSQATVGNTVYAVGAFKKARPAGSAAGVNEVSRSNMLAYDITTGILSTSFKHFVNATAFVAALTPDKTKLFIGGDFASVDSQPHARIAEFNTATGDLVAAFAPTVNGRVAAIAATNASVYFGGQFTTVNGVARTRLAAADVNTGALLSWAPTADDNAVSTMVMTPTNNRVIVGGRFSTLNHATARGSGSIDAVTGATAPWAVNAVVQNWSNNDGITSLRTDGTQIYGTGYVFGGTGNLEGTFAADPQTGTIRWIEDCHGDTYDSLAVGQVVYVVSHEHYCGNVGTFAEKADFKHATAFTNYATGTLLHNASNGKTVTYHDWGGQPSPTQLNWYPTMTTGTITGQSQAAWSLTGNASFISAGGEFPTVNSAAQAGLVRFAVSSVAPNKVGPRPGGQLTPKVTSLSSGTAHITWGSTFDQDNEALTYKLVRDGKTTAPIYTTTVNSTHYRTPPVGFTDSGLTPGSTHTYRVYVYDAFNNSNSGSTVTFTLPPSYPPPSSYANAVAIDGPTSYWRLGEASGTNGYDSAGFNDLVEQAGVGHGAAGALTGDTDTASTFTGASGGAAIATGSALAPNTFSVEAWFKTTSHSGGLIAGYGDATTTLGYLADRVVYLDATGHVRFGVTTPTIVKTGIASAAAFNNGAWHHVVATLSASGMRLYVDGAPVATNAGVTSGETYVGYWNVGGFPALVGWPATPTSPFLAGSLDDVAVYPTELTATRILAHYQAGKTTDTPLTAAFTPSCTDLGCSVNASASAGHNGGSIASYGWDFGDGGSATGVTATHSYPTPGTYPITLNITDGEGGTDTVTHAVSVTAPGIVPLASDMFGRTLASAWGTADKGGPWSVAGSASNLSVSPGAGSMKLPAANAQVAAFLGGISRTAAESDATVSVDKSVSGGAYTWLVGRRASATAEYRGKVKFLGSKVVASITSVVGSTELPIGTAAILTPVYPPGTLLNVRFQVSGTGPTTLQLKVWGSTETEPAAWTVTGNDSTPALQVAGSVGVTSYLASGSGASAPVTIKVSNYQALPLP